MVDVLMSLIVFSWLSREMNCFSAKEEEDELLVKSFSPSAELLAACYETRYF